MPRKKKIEAPKVLVEETLPPVFEAPADLPVETPVLLKKCYAAPGFTQFYVEREEVKRG
jgi:hypothetical protein